MSENTELLDRLPTATASDIKKQGWRSVMKTVNKDGRILITNHNEPEAVILSTKSYENLLQAARGARLNEDDPLAELRARFDARLSILNTPDANKKLRTIMDNPLNLEGVVVGGITR